MKIAFDIDGVIANSEVAIRDEILQHTGHDVDDLWKTYNFAVPGYEWPQIYDMIQDGIMNREVDPHEGAIESIKLLREYQEHKYPITFVTARPDYLHDVTHNWIKEHVGGNYEIEFAENKSEYLNKNNFKVFIEDRLKTANDLSKDLSVIYLINRPWNIGRDHAWNVIRVDSISEAVEKYIGGTQHIVNL